MEFRTQFDRKIVTSNAGSNIKIVRAAEYDKHKNIVVADKGKENLFQKIQSYADSVNIHVLLARFMNGDKESLMQRAGAYIDVSSLPTNINEFIDLARNAENLFNTLPIEVKEKFNNNLMEFVSTIGDKEWIEKMNTSPSDIKLEKANVVKEAVQASKKAVKNSVYGDQIENPSVDSVVQPVKEINPITGNEVSY